MRRIIIFLPLIAIFLVSSCSHTTKSVWRGQTILLTDSLLSSGGSDTLRLGHIYSGEVVERRFRLENCSSKPLVLLGYKSTCGCTTLHYERCPIQPSASADIKCRFDSAGEYGWTLTVLSLEFGAENADFHIFVECEID